MPKKFTTYTCDTCRRSIDIDNDPSHTQIEIVKKSKDNRFIDVSQINKCIITLGCEGRLQPTGEKNVRNIARSTSSDTAEDWIKRGEEASQQTDDTSSTEFFPIASNDNQDITIAIKNGTVVSGFLTIEIALDRPVEYVDYKYISEDIPIQLITGKDTHLKNLSFAGSDTVSVKYNGIELYEDEEWVRKSLTHTGVYDTIEFILPLTDPGITKILVYKKAPVTKYKVQFAKHDENFSISPYATAWANVKTVTINGLSYTLYDMNITEDVPINSFFSLTERSFNNGSIDIDDCYFLLSDAPWSNKDRNYITAISCRSLVSVKSKIKYYQKDGVKYIEAQKAAISNINPPIHFHLTAVAPNLPDVFSVRAENEVKDKFVKGASDVPVANNSKIIGVY